MFFVCLFVVQFCLFVSEITGGANCCTKQYSMKPRCFCYMYNTFVFISSIYVCVYLYEVIYGGCGVCQVCNRPASCTEELRSQKTPSVSAASTSGREDVCGETPTSADNHSGVQEFCLSPGEKLCSSETFLSFNYIYLHNDK